MNVGVPDVKGGNYKVVLSLVFGQLFLADRVFGVNGSQTVQRLKVARSGGKGSDFHSKFIGKLDAQMTQTSNSNDGTSFSRTYESLERSVDSDACAEERSYLVETVMKGFRDLNGPVLVDLDVRAVPTKVFSV